jgi:hypothetical protein
MHVAFGRTAVTAVVLMLAVAGCGGAAHDGPSVPTFPSADVAAGATGAGPAKDEGAVPDDCARLITVGDLGALLGLPLDTVALHTTQHVGAPAVGRTERVACDYTGQGSVRGRLLELDVSAYTDPQAATAQWRLNSDAEDGTRSDIPIGDASAVLVERRGEAVLRVVHGTSNLAFVLADRKLPEGRTPRDVLVDLALRVLPVVSRGADQAAAGGPPSPAPASATDT